GTYLLGSLAGILQSDDGHAWTAIPNTIPAISIVSGGKQLFSSREYAADGQPYSAANEDDIMTWTAVTTPSIQAGGGMGYDAAHKVLYSTNYASGFWRVVTR